MAAVLGGRSPATAKVGDRCRQTLRDRAQRCDADGPKGLFDRRAPGKPSELTEAQPTQAQRTARSGARPGRAHPHDPSRPGARALLARPRPRCAAACPALHHGPGRPGCGGAWCRCPARRRASWRNGYRDRAFDIRLGQLNLRIPKLRTGSWFPLFLAARKTTEKALTEEAWIAGVSTRKVDDLVQGPPVQVFLTLTPSAMDDPSPDGSWPCLLRRSDQWPPGHSWPTPSPTCWPA